MSIPRGPSRPRFEIPEEVITGLHDLSSWHLERRGYLTKQFYEGGISILYRLTIQLVRKSPTVIMLMCDFVTLWRKCASSDVRRRRNLRYWCTTKQGDKCSEVAYTLCDFYYRPSQSCSKAVSGSGKEKIQCPLSKCTVPMPTS